MSDNIRERLRASLRQNSNSERPLAHDLIDEIFKAKVALGLVARERPEHFERLSAIQLELTEIVRSLTPERKPVVSLEEHRAGLHRDVQGAV